MNGKIDILLEYGSWLQEHHPCTFEFNLSLQKLRELKDAVSEICEKTPT